jgi:hypothetical protein
MVRLCLTLSLVGVVILFCARPSYAGIGVRSAGGKVGFDVVQAEDTRLLFGGQIDVGNILGSSLHVEPNFEFGRGLDERGEEKRVSSINVALKYLLEEEKTRFFAYFSGEIGVNVFSAVLFQGAGADVQGGGFSNAWVRKTAVRPSFNIVPIGLGRKIARGRARLFCELKIVLGEEASDSSLRCSAGLGFLID